MPESSVALEQPVFFVFEFIIELLNSARKCTPRTLCVRSMDVNV